VSYVHYRHEALLRNLERMCLADRRPWNSISICVAICTRENDIKDASVVPQGKISEVNAFIVGANHEENFPLGLPIRETERHGGGIRRFTRA